MLSQISSICTNFVLNNLISISILFLLLAFWWIINRPLNRIRYLGQVGYNSLSGASKAEIVRKVQQNRRIGELPPVYPNGWFCLAESRELKPGGVKAVSALGQQLVVFRSKVSRTVHVLDAYCPHMGAHLGMGGQTVHDNCIQCPFHGWIFQGTEGGCVKIPYSSQSIPSKARQKSWPCVEINCHIYFWYHCDGVEPTWEVPEVTEISDGSWSYGGRTEHYINCHIEEIPENGADVAHLNFLHAPNVLMGTDLSTMDLHTGGVGKHVWEAQWEPQPSPNQHIGVLNLTHSLELFGVKIPGTEISVEAKQIGPGIVYLILDAGCLGKGAFIQHLTPQAPLSQKLIHHIYTARRIPVFIAKTMLLFETYQVERDIMIWNNKTYQRTPILVKEERLISRHRRWYSQFFTENSQRLTESTLLNGFIKTDDDNQQQETTVYAF